MKADHSREELDRLFGQLSPRQREVLRLHAAYQTAKEIARELGIKESTVRDHLDAVRRRLDVPTARDAVRLFIQYQAVNTPLNDSGPQLMGIADLAEDVSGEAGAAAVLSKSTFRWTSISIWVQALFKSMPAISWLALTLTVTYLVIVLTVGVFSGARALIETLQEFRGTIG